MRLRLWTVVIFACTLAACGGGGSAPGGPPAIVVSPVPSATPSPAPSVTATPFPLSVLSKGIYVADYSGNEIVEYAPGVSRSTASVATISGAASCVSAPTGVAVDSSGRIYVANESGCSGQGAGDVTVYAAGANGNVAPVSTLSGTSGGFQAESIALDSAGDVFVGLGQNSPADGYKFTAGSSGTAAPAATYASTCATCAFSPIVVTKSGAVAIHDLSPQFSLFSATATGTVSASGNFSSASMPNATGAALDQSGNIVVATNGEASGSTGAQPVALLTFAPNASGSVAPIASISGTNTRLQNLNGVAVDGNGYIYVLNAPLSNTGTNCSIDVFAPGETGNAAPAAVFPSVCGRGIAVVP